jgi:tetratricopeptide (TPR) repeat protein
VPLLILCAAAAAASPFLWAAWVRHQARQYLSRHQARLAGPWLERWLRWTPDEPEAHLLAAQAARLRGDYEAASRELTECQRLEGGKRSDASLLEWALLHAENGSLEKVESFLREQYQRHPEQAVLILEALAMGYLRLYRFQEAMQSLEECLRRDPDNPHALYVRGRAWERVHAYSKAVEDYGQVVAGDPDDDETRLRLANALIDNGESAQAVDHLELLRRRQPDNPETLIRLAFAWNAVGRLQDSIGLLDEVLARYPEMPLALSARGQLAFQAEHLEEAESLLRRAIAANPYDRQAHYVLQQCLEQQGKKTEAAAQKKQLDEVEGTIKRLIAIANQQMPKDPHNPALHCELGALLEKMGHADLALRWYHSALLQDAEYGPAHAALARYYERAGDLEQAAQHRQPAAPHP